MHLSSVNTVSVSATVSLVYGLCRVYGGYLELVRVDKHQQVSQTAQGVAAQVSIIYISRLCTHVF